MNIKKFIENNVAYYHQRRAHDREADYYTPKISWDNKLMIPLYQAQRIVNDKTKNRGATIELLNQVNYLVGLHEYRAKRQRAFLLHIKEVIEWIKYTTKKRFLK